MNTVGKGASVGALTKERKDSARTPQSSGGSSPSITDSKTVSSIFIQWRIVRTESCVLGVVSAAGKYARSVVYLLVFVARGILSVLLTFILESWMERHMLIVTRGWHLPK